MSAPAMPCREPYQAASLREDSKTVTLVVGNGAYKVDLLVHAVLLYEGSGYFKKRFDEREADDLVKPFGFPQGDPSLFRILIDYLYNGKLRLPNPQRYSASEAFFRFIPQLFGFASDLDAFQLRNAILDEYFLRIFSQPHRLPLGHVRDVYDNTSENSSLRDLIVTIVTNIGSWTEVELYHDELPRQFLLDCLKIAAEDGLVLFAKHEEEKARVWLEDKKGRMCMNYHVHVLSEHIDDTVDEFSMLTMRY